MELTVGTIGIIAVVVLGGGAAVFLAVQACRRIGRRVSAGTLGTVAELIRYAETAMKNRDINDRLSTTPKSLSAMDRIYLPQIQADFPEFSWSEFRPIVEQSIVSVLRAIDERRPELVSDNPRLREIVENALAAEQVPRYTDVRIHNTVISRYYREKGTCYIICESAVEYFTYVQENGKIIKGYKDRKRQEVYETELIYVQNAESGAVPAEGTDGVGLTCPNCGAPVTNLGQKRCEYCGSAIEPLNIRVWRVNAVRLT